LSIYEIMQILGISVFDKTPVNQLIRKDMKKKETENTFNLFNMNDL